MYVIVFFSLVIAVLTHFTVTVACIVIIENTFLQKKLDAFMLLTIFTIRELILFFLCNT